jgi:hypothetical protein
VTKGTDDKGRTVYAFEEEECEVVLCEEKERAFVAYHMDEGWEEEDCARVLGGIDGDVDMRLVDALPVWNAAWERAEKPQAELVEALERIVRYKMVEDAIHWGAACKRIARNALEKFRSQS